MRAILFAAALALLAVSLATVVPARADNGPHQASTGIADRCAACHRIHTAQSETLLKAGSPTALCFSCHDGTGADTRATDGQYLAVAGRGLRGGGFENATMDTNWDGAASASAVTSNHMVNGTGTAWGNGAINSGPGLANFSLSCIACHDPHGGAGTDGAPTYRILRAVPTGSGAAAGVEVPDEATKSYGVTDANNRYFTQTYGSQRDPLSNWCAQCHTRYSAPQDSETTPSGDAIFAYRHMTIGGADCQICHPAHGPGPFVPPNPFHIPSTVVHRPTCESCHVAHGTSATMGTYSGAVEWPDGAASPSGSERSSLLRLDNRGLCVMCHGAKGSP